MNRSAFTIAYNRLNREPSWELWTDPPSQYPPCFHISVQEALDCIIIHNGILSFNLEVLKPKV